MTVDVFQPTMRPDIPTLLKTFKSHVTTPPPGDKGVALSVREALLEEKQVMITKKEMELQEKEKELSQRERHLAGSYLPPLHVSKCHAIPCSMGESTS